MIYYRVKPQYDQKRKSATNCDILVANELYTERERQELKVADEAFDRVEIPKSQVYWFFGARFQKQASPWTATPILERGN